MRLFIHSIILLHLIIYIPPVSGQISRDPKSHNKGNYIEYGEYIIYEGDTLLIQLDEVRLLKKLKFKNLKDRHIYYWYRRKVLKAYPYAKMFEEKLEVINKRLETMPSKRAKKRYTKRLEKYFEQEFTEQLKKLTRTEGKILIKLIHRQSGRTAFDWLKDLRSGWKAYWSDKMAKMFKLSLKMEYHPESDDEDWMIEDILQRAFNDGVLEEQKTKLPFNYEELSLKKEEYIKVKWKKK